MKRDYINVRGYRQPIRSERDAQRQKLYNSESVLSKFDEKFETVSEIIHFIDTRVIASRPLQNRYEVELRRGIFVGDGRRRSSAGGDSKGIYMPKWSRVSHVILHEIAHTITIRRHGYYIAGHGREYCAIYLDLIRYVLGVEAYEALKTSFRAHRVRFTQKRKVEYSEEQKQAMRERMQMARAKLPQTAKTQTAKIEVARVEVNRSLTCGECGAKISGVADFVEHADSNCWS